MPILWLVALIGMWQAMLGIDVRRDKDAER